MIARVSIVCSRDVKQMDELPVRIVGRPIIESNEPAYLRFLVCRHRSICWRLQLAVECSPRPAGLAIRQATTTTTTTGSLMVELRVVEVVVLVKSLPLSNHKSSLEMDDDNASDKTL